MRSKTTIPVLIPDLISITSIHFKGLSFVYKYEEKREGGRQRDSHGDTRFLLFCALLIGGVRGRRYR